MRKALRSLGVLLLVLFLSGTAAFAGIRKGPYLIFEGSNTSMTVLWQTDGTESNVIRWGTDTSYSMGNATVGVYGADYQHKYVITGLQPGTKYYYQVDGYGSGSFRTAPAATATAVKFLAYGDSRTYPASHETVAAKMRAKYAADPAYQTLVLHDGDFIGSDTEADWTSHYFVSGATYPQMRALQAEVPMIGARGNHEGTGAVYKKYFPFPYVANYYWSFDYGPVHFTVIDNYATFTSGSAQYNWLVNDLSSTTKPWKIVLQHEPGWGAGTHGNNANIQNALHPLFKQYGVDLIVNGHNHNYARALVENKHYVTTGGGGASLYTPDPTYPNIVKTDKSYHHTEIDIAGSTLTMTARRADGTVIETISVPQSSGSGGSTTVTSRVSAGTDDVEEQQTGGTMYMNSSDLELVYDTGDQWVALRFPDIDVPRGAVISRAWLQLEADEAQSEATNLSIRGQAADDALAFSTGSPISSRPRTEAAASWAPAAWRPTPHWRSSIRRFGRPASMRGHRRSSAS